MKTKIMIKTPKGQAEGTEQKIRNFIIPRKISFDTYVNEENDTIIWEIEGTVNQIMKINRNVSMFDTTMKGILNNKLMRKACEKDQLQELDDMLRNQTTVEIIKEATAQEWVEANKTWWQNIKEKFKKKN